eukprot:CFRG2266T1
MSTDNIAAFAFINEKVLVRQYDCSKPSPLGQSMLRWMDNVGKVVRNTAAGYQPKYVILALPQLGHRKAGIPNLETANTHIVEIQSKPLSTALHAYFRGLNNRPMYLEVWLVSQDEEKHITEFLEAHPITPQQVKKRSSFIRRFRSSSSSKIDRSLDISIGSCNMDIIPPSHLESAAANGKSLYASTENIPADSIVKKRGLLRRATSLRSSMRIGRSSKKSSPL